MYIVEVVTAKLQTLKLSFSFLSRYRPFVPHIPFDFYVVSKNTTLVVVCFCHTRVHKKMKLRHPNAGILSIRRKKNYLDVCSAVS